MYQLLSCSIESIPEKMLPFQFLEDPGPFDNPGSNNRIGRLCVVEFNDIFQVDAEEYDLRVSSGIRRDPGHYAPSALYPRRNRYWDDRRGGKYGIGMPVYVRFGMIVDSHFYTVDAGQAVDPIPLCLDGLGGEITQTEFLTEFKIFFPFGEILWNDDTHCHDADAF